MHRVDVRSYVGAAAETVTVTTTVTGGGQASLTLDDKPFTGTQFPMPTDAGGHRSLVVRLVGPPGASCTTGIATVDGGTDGDFLLCQAHNPSPQHPFNFGVAAAGAIKAFTALKKAVARPKVRGTARTRKAGSRKAAARKATRRRGAHK